MTELYRHFRMQRLGSLVVIQPFEGDDKAGPSLTVDLRTGTIALADHHTIAKEFSVIKGIMGMVRLQKSSALVVIDEALEVARLRGVAVYQVKAVRLCASLTTEDESDQTLLNLVEAGINPEGYGRTMYFSYDTDITLNTQRAAVVAADKELSVKALARRADPRFTWNKAMLAPLLEPGKDLDRFALPIMIGLVKQLPAATFRVSGSERTACFTLIARRSCLRAGTRYWRRGADIQGNAANFVESEQVLTFEDYKVTSSYIQIRGSMPLLWSQAPNIKYKPPTYMAPVADCQPAFDKHVNSLLEQYKSVTAINLANQHGSEGKLGDTLQQLAGNYSKTHSGFRLVSFDFHKECGATKYERLQLLWNQIDEDIAKFGYYVTTPKGAKQQQGIFRINCIDSLDRTNVVQGMLGRKQLEAQLRKLDALPPNETLASYYPEFDYKFKNIWADHGDEISCQYAGTGALKSQFTRTGKRDIRGLLDDGHKSMVRYYLNNFKDGVKQDAMDMITASFKVDPGQSVKFKHQPSPFYPVVVSLLAWFIALNNMGKLNEAQLQGLDWVMGLVKGVLIPICLSVGIAALLFKYGRRFVKSPQLRPDLVQVWRK